MFLAEGEQRWTTPVLTDHLRTVIGLAQHFLPIEVSVEAGPDGTGVVRLLGAGTQGLR